MWLQRRSSEWMFCRHNCVLMFFVLFGFWEGFTGWWFQIFLFFNHIRGRCYLGKMSNLTNIFQMGWNHQLVMFCLDFLEGLKIWVQEVWTSLKLLSNCYLGGGYNYFLFSPLFGEMIQLNIFQMGWNHQLVMFCLDFLEGLKIWVQEVWTSLKLLSNCYLGGGYNYFLFSPLFGEMIQLNIFQMGWNHQLVMFCLDFLEGLKIWVQEVWTSLKLLSNCYLGGGYNYFLFSPLFGEMIQFN